MTDGTIWGDVRFDAPAAAEAAIAMRRAATLLDSSMQQRGVLAALARDGWSGRWRESFDRDFAGAARRATDLIAALNASAAALDRAATDAAGEQARRATMRGNFYTQRAAQEDATATRLAGSDDSRSRDAGAAAARAAAADRDAAAAAGLSPRPSLPRPTRRF